MSLGLVFSCEHASCRVPAEWARLFGGRRAAAALRTHRGWDPGALSVASALSRRFGAPLHRGSVTRLLVDLNRSPHNPGVFSEFSRTLGKTARQRLLKRYHEVYRKSVSLDIAELVGQHRRVLHVSVHSFTPRLSGRVRRADIGLLYDPARRGEAALCARFKSVLAELDPGLLVRRNYPYRGNADGLTRHLRQEFPAAAYLGVELELNQARLLGPKKTRLALIDTVGRALGQVIGRTG